MFGALGDVSSGLIPVSSNEEAPLSCSGVTHQKENTKEIEVFHNRCLSSTLGKSTS